MPLLKVTNRYSAWQRESDLRITEVHALILGACHSEPLEFGGEESLKIFTQTDSLLSPRTYIRLGAILV